MIFPQAWSHFRGQYFLLTNELRSVGMTQAVGNRNCLNFIFFIWLHIYPIYPNSLTIYIPIYNIPHTHWRTSHPTIFVFFVIGTDFWAWSDVPVRGTRPCRGTTLWLRFRHNLLPLDVFLAHPKSWSATAQIQRLSSPKNGAMFPW